MARLLKQSCPILGRLRRNRMRTERVRRSGAEMGLAKRSGDGARVARVRRTLRESKTNPVSIEPSQSLSSHVGLTIPSQPSPPSFLEYCS
jgi:hypothetical protein